MKIRIVLTAKAMLGLALMFFTSSCSDPFVPVLPDWDVPMSVPFASETITVRDLVEQDSSIIVTNGTDGQMRATLISCTFIDTIAYKMTPETAFKLQLATNGVLMLEVDNHLPVEVIVEPVITGSDYTPLLTPTTTSGDLMRIAPATLGSDMKTITPVRSKVEVVLTGTDFDKLVEGKFLIIRLKLTALGSIPVALTLDDFLRLRSYARVEVNSNIIL